MSKKLILFRHGKSDWSAVYKKDCDRNLTKRGIETAKTMGRLLSNATPDLVITSSAVRAKRTVELALQAGQWGCPVQVTNQLYEASPTQVLTIIHQVAIEINTLLLAGHEPTCSALASQLIGGGQLRFPTGAIARIDFDVDIWQQVTCGQGVLRWLLQPKLFQP
ncbi:2,3-bisphosphoglycerate-dependent phosphoglycerate mutase [Acaryochloris thomasi RCC1774]|uniref:2,3-bisphosphoglycerate-dependent phosphoglycerate mutase n=1 Tax=Acaryochloris thomasi RCC1774 TaxID=1764569 RepID=A0A2W1JKQ8_9CYAN|nr:histidine phosphatase family protein [Acaryochloris thomasi]PZD73959.1 2,3-bisphosphoglycerate-dependent phosphoglycerate mutase [Acaryochloris thomasi RCC1774]